MAEHGFFTLTELQDKLKLDERRRAKAHTVGRGAPHVSVGREIILSTSSFDAWIKANEQVKHE